MTANESDGNTRKKKNEQCNLSLLHASSVSLVKNYSRQRVEGGADRLVQSAIHGKNVDRAVFWSDFMKMSQKTRYIRSRALPKEEIDFHLLMALVFHDLQGKKSGAFTSLIEAILKNAWVQLSMINFK